MKRDWNGTPCHMGDTVPWTFVLGQAVLLCIHPTPYAPCEHQLLVPLFSSQCLIYKKFQIINYIHYIILSKTILAPEKDFPNDNPREYYEFVWKPCTISSTISTILMVIPMHICVE